MPITEEVTLYVVPLSHPCMTVRAALELKGVGYREEAVPSSGHRGHGDEAEKLFGEGNRKVPVLAIGDEFVHGSVTILERLDELTPADPLYPEAIAAEVSEAERWGDEVFQELARRLPFAVLHFRPGAMGTFAGAGEFDPAGTDFAMAYVRAAWEKLGLSAVQVTEDLAAIPPAIERIEGYAEAGLIDGDSPTAADLQIASSAALLLTIGDLRPALAGTAAERIAGRYFPDDYTGDVPAGAFPESWLAPLA
jgi:glutathione S-transferase